MTRTLRAWLLLVWWLNSGYGYGQTLHLLVFADTNDPTIGSNNLKTYTSLTGSNGMAATVARQAGLTLHPLSFYGADCQVDQLNQTLDGLRVGADDVVLFYFVGHGYNSRQNEYPSLIFGNANAEPATIDAASRNLREIYARIRAKNPRLTIAIGDACNKERTDLPAPVNSVRTIGVMPPQTLSSERFRSLFRNWQGGILMSSSRRNEYSHTDAKGGWMSVSFQNTLNDLCAGQRKGMPDWKGVLDETVTRTAAIAQHNGQAQMPQYLLELMPYVGRQTLIADSDKRPGEVICPSPDQFVNEIALSGIRDDMPLLKEMRTSITSSNAQAFADAFTEFYQNQRPFYQSLGTVLFNSITDLSPDCQKKFARDTEWLSPDIREINRRYDVIQRYANKPAELVQHARSELPSILVRLEAILERLDK